MSTGLLADQAAVFNINTHGMQYVIVSGHDLMPPYGGYSGECVGPVISVSKK